MDDLIKTMRISGAGMWVQGQRLRVISQNIANVNSLPQDPGDKPYRRQVITFKNELDRSIGLETVRAGKVRPDKSEFGKRYEPSHPAADADGYVLTPNVNTLIVNREDSFGLAQLYQLRGRVGRGAKRAYAYLLIPPARALTETAEKRLKTMLAATELGAGFRIAMADLEIRGAGNILGSQQSGHIHAVGFDLYTRLLSTAVEDLRARAASGGDGAQTDGAGVSTSEHRTAPGHSHPRGGRPAGGTAACSAGVAARALLGGGPPAARGPPGPGAVPSPGGRRADRAYPLPGDRDHDQQHHAGDTGADRRAVETGHGTQRPAQQRQAHADDHPQRHRLDHPGTRGDGDDGEQRGTHPQQRVEVGGPACDPRPGPEHPDAADDGPDLHAHPALPTLRDGPFGPSRRPMTAAPDPARALPHRAPPAIGGPEPSPQTPGADGSMAP